MRWPVPGQAGKRVRAFDEQRRRADHGEAHGIIPGRNYLPPDLDVRMGREQKSEPGFQDRRVRQFRTCKISSLIAALSLRYSGARLPSWQPGSGISHRMPARRARLRGLHAPRTRRRPGRRPGRPTTSRRPRTAPVREGSWRRAWRRARSRRRRPGRAGCPVPSRRAAYASLGGMTSSDPTVRPMPAGDRSGCARTASSMTEPMST